MDISPDSAVILGLPSSKARAAVQSAGGAIRGKTCVAVLLTHNRPQNMWLLVKGALRNRFVTRVIVSNSNPQVKIRDWVASTDPRLTLVDETTPTQPGHRFVLARQTGAEYMSSRLTMISFSPRGSGQNSLNFFSLTRSVRTELLDRFIARAPSLRMAARFII